MAQGSGEAECRRLPAELSPWIFCRREPGRRRPAAEDAGKDPSVAGWREGPTAGYAQPADYLSGEGVTGFGPGGHFQPSGGYHPGAPTEEGNGSVLDSVFTAGRRAYAANNRWGSGSHVRGGRGRSEQ